MEVRLGQLFGKVGEAGNIPRFASFREKKHQDYERNHLMTVIVSPFFSIKKRIDIKSLECYPDRKSFWINLFSRT